MRPWMLVFCLVCLSGAMFGALKIQNQVLVFHHVTSWQNPPEVLPQEYAIYAAVIDSNKIHGPRGENETCMIQNVTIRGLSHDHPSEVFTSLGVPQEAIEDFFVKSTHTYPLKEAPKSRIPCPMANDSERVGHPGPQADSIAFSRVGFDVTLTQAALYVVRSGAPGLDYWTSGYFVHLKKRDGCWVVIDAHLDFMIVA